MYFISDTHFHHDKIRTLTNRPFASLHEMNETMISNWNKTVSQDAIVWHLGDFAYGTWKGGDIRETFNRLNGKKNLIVGNHDHDDTLDLPWHEIYDYKEIKYNKNMIVLSHYPIIEWNKSYHGSYHFHGHTHRNNPLDVLNQKNPQFERYRNNWRNVSVEHINYTPIHIDQLLKEKQ